MKETDIEISIRPITPVGNLHGFAAIKIGSIKIDDFKIVKNKNGDLFIGMPSKPDKTSDSGYRNTVVIDKDQQADFNAIATMNIVALLALFCAAHSAQYGQYTLHNNNLVFSKLKS